MIDYVHLFIFYRQLKSIWYLWSKKLGRYEYVLFCKGMLYPFVSGLTGFLFSCQIRTKPLYNTRYLSLLSPMLFMYNRRVLLTNWIFFWKNRGALCGRWYHVQVNNNSPWCWRIICRYHFIKLSVNKSIFVMINKLLCIFGQWQLFFFSACSTGVFRCPEDDKQVDYAQVREYVFIFVWCLMTDHIN